LLLFGFGFFGGRNRWFGFDVGAHGGNICLCYREGEAPAEP
jgi:hypothetical protein